MKSILFVDDERNVLNGLRRQFHRQRSALKMSFALGGAEAMSIVDERPFDVVITDMQMPVVDGTQVLSHVARVQKSCGRLVLSGHADLDQQRIATSCSHRYLNKPCPPQLLELEIEQVLAIRAVLDELEDPRLEALWRPGELAPARSGPVSGRALVAGVDFDLEQLSDQEPARGLVEHLGLASEDGEIRLSGLVEATIRAGREVGVSTECLSEAVVAATVLECMDPNAERRWLDVLAYLLPSHGLSEACVLAITAGESPATPSALGAEEVLGAVCAARLMAGDPSESALAEHLMGLGWGQHVDSWRSSRSS
jgi:CheY-like chemotaxis protein